ncbi:sugar phosphatase YidA [Clostridium acetireducens DSM 10703]|jgi:Cof subfamily protein (haloacid dehalogenase superfamily)|uniref:Sugar phosphatase YidA n=1 Tax=Clostridium acetireducens DSM 10703 TaxID=1121290 RepID=A0A1E8EWT1_9CLOT|nr:Cof-type HAD-IIB family hydrolase [Clostridium acetireducens]OFI05072.1 sugar phosphatase YidA [Clostridium acetireducens DSM 10703]
MKYKLVCIDMDGTLLNDDKKISERTLKTIKKAKEKGVNIVISTGRLFISADYYSDLIGVKTPVIASNGAYIREKDKDKVIYKSLLGVEKCKEIVNVLNKYNIYMHFNTYNSILTRELVFSSAVYSKMNEGLPKDKKINITLVEKWEDTFNKYKDEILKCIIIEKDKEKLIKAKKEMSAIEGFEVVSSSKYNFEIMNKGVSKGNAVKILSSYYNLHKDNIICIGDSENDLSMLEYAGLGIAMKNGEDYVKENADYITDTNNNDGVAKAIEKFILD